MNPTTTRDWGWALRLEKLGKVYGTSNSISVPIEQPTTVQEIPNIDIGMSLSNTGESSTYTFKIPRLEGLTEGITDLYIQFPNDLYDERLGNQISCSMNNEINLLC